MLGNYKYLLLSVVFYIQLNKKYLENLPGPFFITGTPLPTCNSVRDLGVVVNESLSPSSHIAKITATAYNQSNPIQSTFIPDNKVHNTYYSYSNKSKEK